MKSHPPALSKLRTKSPSKKVSKPSSKRSTKLTAKRTADAAAFRGRLRRQPPKVRPHASGSWTVNIGKALDKSKSNLRPKDFYWRCTEDAANAAAAKLYKRWAFIFQNWDSLYGRTLTVLGSPFADVPHWDAALGKSDISDADVEAYQNQTPSAEQIAEAYADIKLKGVFGLYQIELKVKVANGEKGKTTSWTDQKNVRCCMRFFNENMRLDELTATEIKNVKTNMLGKVSRRAADNYLGAFKRMLTWFYDSDYGRGWERPSDFANIFAVKKATKKPTIPSIADVKLILDSADDRQRLDIMLALNCGMYATDIGRLTLAEINLTDGYVFWDREKQPNNEFKIRHDLWAETLQLVKRFIQPKGTEQRFFADYRGDKPIQVDCSALAFVDVLGNPIYRIRANGKAYDKIAKGWQLLQSALKDNNVAGRYQFFTLRKATNQILSDLLQSKVDGDDRGQLIAVGEISDMFLGHKSTELQRLYDTRGVNGFARLNKYLAEVGDTLRKTGAFDCYKGSQSA